MRVVPSGIPLFQASYLDAEGAAACTTWWRGTRLRRPADSGAAVVDLLALLHDPV